MCIQVCVNVKAGYWRHIRCNNRGKEARHTTHGLKKKKKADFLKKERMWRLSNFFFVNGAIIKQ